MVASESAFNGIRTSGYLKNESKFLFYTAHKFMLVTYLVKQETSKV